MQVSIHTGATPGNMVPSSYKVNFDLSQSAAHLGERMEGVIRAALDYAVDGVTSIGIRMLAGELDAAKDLAKVGIGTAVVGAGGTLAAGVAEFNDLMNNTHEVPTTSWVSYRNSLNFLGTQDDGNSTTPLVYKYQMQSGVVVATTPGGMTFNGNAGDNRIVGTTKGNTIKGGDGNDSLYGSNGNDTIYGDNGVDWLRGGNDNDRIYASGSDTAFGDNGNDKISVHGTGAATMWGGAGRDTFIFNTDDGYATSGGDIAHARYIDDFVTGFGNATSFTYRTDSSTWMGGFDITSMKNARGDTIRFDDGVDDGPNWYGDNAPTLAQVNAIMDNSDFFI